MTLNEAIIKISDEARSLGYSEKQIRELTPDIREMLYDFPSLDDYTVNKYIEVYL